MITMVFHESYIHSYVSALLSRILTKTDFSELLVSKTVDEAIKVISNKPIGTELYTLVLEKRLELKKINEAINNYIIERHNNLYNYIPPRHRKHLDPIEGLFDSINITLFYSNLIRGGRAEYLIPAGKIFRMKVDLEKVENIDDLVDILVDKGLKIYANVLKGYTGDPIKLFYILTRKVLPISKPLDIPYRRLLGSIHDLLWILMCGAKGEIPKEVIPSFYGLSINEFNNACLSKSLEDIPAILQDGYFKDFAEILRYTNKISIGSGSLFLGSILYLSVLTKDLLTPYTSHPYVRYYILILSEGVLVNTCLVAIAIGMFAKELKDLINGWWVL